MKKIFILAIVATIASFSFAQSARSLKPGQKFSVQRVMTSADLTKATETRKFEQTKAEKAKAASKASDNRQKTALSQRIFSPTAKVVSNHFNARPLALNAPHKAYKASKTEQRDEHGIIIAPAEGDTTYYKRTGHCYYYDYYVCYDMQSGHIAIVECENGDVYIKDPVCKFAEGTWVKGAKNGNTITVATNQPVAYSEDYNATVSLRWCAFDNNGNMIAAKDAPDHFTYTIDGNVITLEGSSYELLMGIVWDDNNEATGYADYQTVLTADPGYKPASREPVKIPEGLATETWYGRGAIYASGSSERYKKPLTLGFDGNDVYVQGIFNEFPEAWIKGKIENGVATFPSMQYLGKLYTYDIWISGLTYDDYNPVLEDFVMNFDAATKTFTAVNEIVENSMEDQLSYVFRIIGLKISAEEPYTGPTTVPYFCPVQTLDDLDEFAIIDANNDNYIWELYEGEGARYGYSYNDADDWLITRGIELKAGCAYAFGFDMRAQGYDERIEVKMGKEQTAAAMTTTIIPATDFFNTEYMLYENNRITVPEDGVYYFGIHAISDADRFNIYVRNVYVDEGLLPNAPAAVSNLKLAPAADGSRVATLTFDAPTKDINGNPLEATSLSVDVYRDGNVVKSLVSSLGQHNSFTDYVETDTTYTYKVITHAGDILGDKAIVAGWVGLDIPSEVENAKIDDKITSITATWDPVSNVGAHGGVVIPETTTYNFCNVEMYEMFGVEFPILGDPINTEPITGTTFTTEMDTCEGEQNVVYYAVQAVNATGGNDGKMITMLKGAPYKLPLQENFAGNFSYLWDYYTSSNYCSADIANNPSDDDSYNIQLGSWSYEPEMVCFQSGKIALEGAKNATLCIDAKKDNRCKEVVKVFVLRSNGEYVEVETLNLTQKYARYQVALNQFKDDLWIRFYIQAEFSGEGYVDIDNISVSDLYESNMSISVASAQYVTAGKSASVKAVVNNEGRNEASGYTVKFYANDNLIAEYAASETSTLAPGKKAEYAATYQTSALDKAGEVALRAEVALDGDMKPEDNTAETSISVILPASSPVESVSAVQTEQGVEISWTAPEDPSAEVVENFESYEGNTIYRDGEYCGEWKAADVSKGMSYGWQNREILWPHTNEIFGFGIVDTEASKLTTLAKLSALSGVNALGFFSEYNADTYNDQKSDRYAISPELKGVAQTISFNVCIFTNAYGRDTFEVLASSTGTNLEDFTKVAEFVQGQLGWHTFMADLPAGTKHFALHYTSNCTFGMLVDDVTYLASTGAPTAYNVYIDGELVATVDASDTSFTYPQQLSGFHTASVTVVYGENESQPVTVQFGGAGIDAIEGEDGEMVIYNVAGVRVAADKLERGIYIINGQKRVVK